MQRLFTWLDKNKYSKNKIIIILRGIYYFGRLEPLHAIIDTILSIFIPITFENKMKKTCLALIILLIVDIILNYTCNKYQKKQYDERKFAMEVLKSESALLNSINIKVNANGWTDGLFNKISEWVCQNISSNFKDVFNCDTRVSIIYVFNKLKGNEKKTFLGMSGRKSPSRSTPRQPVLLDKKKQYYFYRLFDQHKQGLYLLSEKEIRDENIWHINTNTDVKRYFAIAVNTNNEEKGQIDFILQIDCLDEIKIGDKYSRTDRSVS